VQIIIALTFITTISKLYNTPKEKRLKADVEYLLDEFNQINKRIIHTEALLGHVKENDSIIYQTIFDTPDYNRNEFEVYYDVDSVSMYSYLVEETNQRISVLDYEMEKQRWLLDDMVDRAEMKQEMLLHIPAIQPIDNDDLKRTASGWGYRIHPIYNISKFHYGQDFTAKSGTPIYATGKGKISHVIPEKSRASQGYGNLIIIDHGFGYRTLYAHLSKFGVEKDDYVERGDIIGYVGSTGISTGPHLHYEVIKNGKKVNPINYFFNDLTPEEYHKIVEISTSIKKSYD